MAFQGRAQSHLHPWAGSVKLKINEPPPINCRAPGGQGLRCHPCPLLCLIPALDFLPSKCADCMTPRDIYWSKLIENAFL